MAGGFSDLFSARAEGATAGVTRSGGQAVFASSLAPQGSQGSSGRADAGGSPSARNAVGDFWSGFGSAGRDSSVGSASAGAAGLGPGGVPGIAVATLGLGFGGILATVAFAAARRRRAEASATAGRNGSIEA
jgi:hypothetical protein